MSAILQTGAAGQGKTQAAVNRIKGLLERRLFGKIWVLLPSELQTSLFRSLLLEQAGGEAHFGVEFFNFYDLYARLLEIAGMPQRRIRDAARFRILRHVLTEEISGQLRHFGAIAQLPGFVALVADFIEELKRAKIEPEAFSGAANTAKDTDLAAIYAGYQEFLRTRSLVDREGEGWLALARLAKPPALNLDVDLLVVDGYDQFTPVQARLLAALAQVIPNTYLTLTYQPERAATAHRRFAQTRQMLLDYGAWTELPMAAQRPARRDALDHLSKSLFDLRPHVLPNDGSLAMVEAPDRQRETQSVLRRVKRLLLDGVLPEQIAIVARNLEAYTPYFLETAPAYGIPLATRRGTPLASNPAVAAFLALIDLPDNDFRRRPVIDTLYSPYLRSPDLTSQQIDQLDAISRGRAIVRGRQTWLDAIDLAGVLPPDQDSDRALDALTPRAAADLHAGLNRFFQRIVPPEKATARDHVLWLEALIGPDPADVDPDDDPAAAPHFSLIEQIQAGSEPDIVARDLAALDRLKRVFAEVLAAYELIDAYESVSWELFRLDLQVAIDNAAIDAMRTASRLGRVLLASVFEARGLPHDYVFLMGLSEGDFPARAPENILYTDDERRQMQARGLPLITQAEAADESSLFYEITALARKELTLSRPYIDEKGNPWPASPYWRAAQQTVQVEVERLPIASEVRLDEAARLSEAALALAQSLGAKLTAESSSVHNWMLAHPTLGAAWKNALQGRRIEVERASNAAAHNAYSGRLADPALLGIVADQLGPERLWSASQFNEYGICPYQFFAKRLLRLEALEEPEEGMDQLQLGSLLHEILEHTYRQIDYEALVITANNLPRASDILDQVADQFLADAPNRHGFRETTLWPHEQHVLRRRLHRLLESDFGTGGPISALYARFDASSGERHSVRQEVRFGWDRQQAITLDGDAGPLRVRGAIDRVDEVNGQAVVIDYKTGSGTIPVEEMVEGRNVQMMIYLHAARQLLQDKQVVSAAFWHINAEKMSGQIAVDAPELEEARQKLHARIGEGRQGNFVNAPSKGAQSDSCAKRCQFRQLCRIDHTGKYKPHG